MCQKTGFLLDHYCHPEGLPGAPLGQERRLPEFGQGEHVTWLGGERQAAWPLMFPHPKEVTQGWRAKTKLCWLSEWVISYETHEIKPAYMKEVSVRAGIICRKAWLHRSWSIQWYDIPFLFVGTAEMSWKIQPWYTAVVVYSWKSWET